MSALLATWWPPVIIALWVLTSPFAFAAWSAFMRKRRSDLRAYLALGAFVLAAPIVGPWWAWTSTRAAGR